MPNYFKIGQGNQCLRQLPQHAIFAYHMVRQTPLIPLSPLRFPDVDIPVSPQLLVSKFSCKHDILEQLM